jgi:hypothetical protein
MVFKMKCRHGEIERVTRYLPKIGVASAETAQPGVLQLFCAPQFG